MRWRQIILGVVLCVSGSGLAGAECGWVLWEKARYSDSDLDWARASNKPEWNIHRAYETMMECEYSKQRVWELKTKQRDPSDNPGIERVEKVPNELLWIYFKGGASSEYEWMCLPGTIDPRPKS
ncbi:MAG: hypothetical protein IH977_02355 [Nitrospinae bacterium]|nr:hypothetical protein [Nitrospinota bacterium]